MPFQVVRLGPNDPDNGLIDAIFDGSLSAVVRSGVASAERLAPVRSALDASEGPLQHPLLRAEVIAGRLTSLGVPISRYDGSDAFFDTGHAVESGLERVLPGLRNTLWDAIARISGGRRPNPARARDGRSFGAYNLRQVPAGGQIPMHAENHHVGWPGFQALVPQQLASTVVSFYLVAGAPEAGGELEVLEARAGEPEVRVLPNGMLEEARLASVARHTVSLAAGDLVVFDGGRFVHRVLPVAGERTRVTIGGFLTRGEDGELYAFS